MLHASFVGPVSVEPGAAERQLFAPLDWLPTLVELAGGAKGEGLKRRIEEAGTPES